MSKKRLFSLELFSQMLFCCEAPEMLRNYSTSPHPPADGGEQIMTTFENLITAITAVLIQRESSQRCSVSVQTR